jgi:hypothetical protein
MVSTEPELDSEGRPRHTDPRDFARPLVQQRRRNWLPWILAAIVVPGLLIFLPRACAETRDVAPPEPAPTAAAARDGAPSETGPATATAGE